MWAFVYPLLHPTCPSFSRTTLPNQRPPLGYSLGLRVYILRHIQERDLSRPQKWVWSHLDREHRGLMDAMWPGGGNRATSLVWQTPHLLDQSAAGGRQSQDSLIGQGPRKGFPPPPTTLPCHKSDTALIICLILGKSGINPFQYLVTCLSSSWQSSKMNLLTNKIYFLSVLLDTTFLKLIDYSVR